MSDANDARDLTDLPRQTAFRSQLRFAVVLIFIFIGLGQITGRILSVNSTNMLALEQNLRNDFLAELKALIATAINEGNQEDLQVYESAAQAEFKFDASELKEKPEAREAAIAAFQRLGRKGPIQNRRDNWDSRRAELSTSDLIQKVTGETKFRREDLLAELKYLALQAHRNNQPENLESYLAAIPQVQQLVNGTSDASGEVESVTIEQLTAPESVEHIEKSKAEAKHHWPIELRLRDSQRIRDVYSTQAIVDIVRKEVNKQRPFLSGNDRSRWLTVRSLVEHGTFEVNPILEYEPSWDSVDIVSHMNANGEQKLYSSKPPLQSILAAIPYWMVHKATGWNLGDNTFEVGRILMFLINVLPLGFGWWCFAKILDDWCDDDLTFVGLMAAACFATMLTTFGVAFNNHSWGAVCALAASMYTIRCFQGSTRAIDFVWAGFWTAMVFTSELPAAALISMFGLLLLIRAPKLTLLAGTPAVLLVLAAYFGTNYIAHGKWSPPYSFGAGDVNTADSVQRENWYDYDFIRYFDGRKVDSYWRSPSNPLDQGEPVLSKYVFHATIGHHGIFSLTPLLLLAIPGLALTCLASRRDQRLWGIAVAVVSVACIAFYLFFLDVRQRNYGGNTSSFRQLMWLHPLWLLASIPITSKLMSRRWGIVLFGILAGLSVLSASYPNMSPWSQTWIWNWMVWAGFTPINR